MASDTTPSLVKTIVARILAYANDAGADVGDYLGTRVYVRRAPSPKTYPYQVVRLERRRPDPELGNVAERFDIVLETFGRPQSTEQTCELAHDLAEEALLTWRESSAALGLSFGVGSDRESVEPTDDPEENDLVHIRSRVECLSFTKRLSNAHT